MICPGCGCVFCPEPPEDPGRAISPYCLPSCRQEARRRRVETARIARKVAAGGLRGICPDCGKDRYATREAAQARITARMAVARPGCDAGGVYRCGEWFHVTSQRQRKGAA